MSIEGNEINNIQHVKLPQFWVNKPELWFTQVESQFFIHKVLSDKAKYHLTVANLPIEIFTDVVDVIKNPPEVDLYENLKKNIINRLTLSEESRLEKLLSNSELGDRKPSNFYRELLQVSGDVTVDKNLLIKLWRRRLPQMIDIALTTSGKNDIAELLILADKVWESQNINHLNTIAEVRTDSLSRIMSEFSVNCQNIFKNISDSQNSLRKEIAILREEVLASKKDYSQQCHSCRQRSSSRGRKNNQHSDDDVICYYHRKYKKNAFKCSGKNCLLNDEFIRNKSKNE